MQSHTIAFNSLWTVATLQKLTQPVTAELAAAAMRCDPLIVTSQFTGAYAARTTLPPKTLHSDPLCCQTLIMRGKQPVRAWHTPAQLHTHNPQSHVRKSAVLLPADRSRKLPNILLPPFPTPKPHPERQ